MKKRHLTTIFLTMVLGILLFQAVVSADVDKLSISQILQKGNDVYLYVSTLDESGRPVSASCTPDEFSVSINKGTRIPVLDVSIFESLNEGTSYIFCIDISRSVTNQEMTEIRSAIADFITQMKDCDYAKIVTIGTEITTVCDSTRDKNALNTALEKIASVADYTYLYKGISYALDGQRKNVDTMPNRAAVILFTDGMDDSDGAASEEQVLLDIAETRIPVYVVGLKGNDSSAKLNSVGQIARQSGGSVFSYNDMSITEALQTIKKIMDETCRLHVRPDDESFGSSNLTWSTDYNSDGYSVSSTNYVYSLSMDGVVFTPEVTEAPEETENGTEAGNGTETENESETESESEDESEAENRSETENESETKNGSETENESETKNGSETETEIESDSETEDESENKADTVSSAIKKLKDFIKDNLIIFIASGLILIALIILLICLLLRHQKNKEKRKAEEEDWLENGTEQINADETLMDTEDNERTLDDLYSFDDEETVDNLNDSSGIRLEFEITFDGQTSTEVRILKEELVLGRGSDCDIDVVLHSAAEERKKTSRKHAVIVDRPDGLYVIDYSKNKTFLNGTEIAGEAVLRDEDVLQLGSASVKVKILNY